MLTGTSKKIVLGALALIALSGIFPPWVITVNADRHGSKAVQDLGYVFIGTPPTENIDQFPRGYNYSVGSIHVSRLVLQWTVIAAVACGLMLVTRRDS